MVAPAISRRFNQPAFFGLGLLLAAWPALALPELHYAERTENSNIAALPPLPSPAQYPVQLVLDDDTWEGILGVGGVTSDEFLWFNRFSSPGDFTLEEIWVLFPQGETTVGDAIQLAAYQDNDANPANGATLLATWNTTVLAADDLSFSVYTLATPLEVTGGGEIWIGVVNRWVTPGVTPLAAPATVDTTTNAGFSGFALYAGGLVPDPPELATATAIQNLNTTPGAGTFLIRAFGSSLPVVDVPVLDARSLAIFAVLLTLAACGALGLRRA